MKRNGDIVLFGYHGMRNTGADARLLAIRRAIHEMAPDAHIRVPTLSRHGIDFVPGVDRQWIPPAALAVSPAATLRRILRNASLLVLTEGNCLTEEFTEYMVKVNMTALLVARELGIPSVGLALDSGKVSERGRQRVVAGLNSASAVTVRSKKAAPTLAGLGVTRQLDVTADCAVSMPLPDRQETERIRHELGIDSERVHGFAPVNFYMWPAKPALVGRPEDYVRYPFKATYPDGGRARAGKLLDTWTALGRHLLADPRAKLALFSMEQVDNRFCDRLAARLAAPGRILRVRCTDWAPGEMAAALTGVRSLVTSRYHALLLAACGNVPYLALAHDTRSFYVSEELGMLDYCVGFESENLVDELVEKHHRLLSDTDAGARIAGGFAELRKADAQNRDLLAKFVAPRRTGVFAGESG